MSRESTARANHKGGNNCAQSVAAAYADALGLSPDEAKRQAPKPRGDGGKCGAYLAGKEVLAKLRPEAVDSFDERFRAAFGSVECKQLRKVGCNDLVGTAARLVEELTQ